MVCKMCHGKKKIFTRVGSGGPRAPQVILPCPPCDPIGWTHHQKGSTRHKIAGLESEEKSYRRPRQERY